MYLRSTSPSTGLEYAGDLPEGWTLNPGAPDEREIPAEEFEALLRVYSPMHIIVEGEPRPIVCIDASLRLQ
jgi:hypothetical protein